MNRINNYQFILMCEIMHCPLRHKNFISMWNSRRNGRLVSDIPPILKDELCVDQIYLKDLINKGIMVIEDLPNGNGEVYKLTEYGEKVFENKMGEFLNLKQ